MNNELATLSWPAIEKRVSQKTIIIPVGSTEQHGPNGLIGTDHLIAGALAKGLGDEMGILVAPTMAYGMSHHHLAFPGTASLRPETLMMMTADIIGSFARNGFSRFFFVNGHGGNVSSMSAAFSQILTDKPELRIQLASWWLLPEVTAREKELFGSENGFHATCGEVAVTWYLFPEAKTPIAPGVAPDPKTEWPVGPERFRMIYPDGRMGSNPFLSTGEIGAELFAIAKSALVAKLSDFLKMDAARG